MGTICMCGAQTSYTHDLLCPFPYFGSNDRRIAEWGKQHEELRGRQKIERRIKELDQRYLACVFDNVPFKPGEREQCDEEMERLQIDLERRDANNKAFAELAKFAAETLEANKIK